MKDAAEIDQHHVAVNKRLRIGHAMRISRRLAELNRHEKRLHAKRNMCGVNEVSHFRGGYAGTQPLEHGLLHAVARIHRRLDDGNLGCGFDLPLCDNHRLGGNDAAFQTLHQGRCENERSGRIDRDKVAGTAERFDALCHQVKRTFILFPDGNFALDTDHRP